MAQRAVMARAPREAARRSSSLPRPRPSKISEELAKVEEAGRVQLAQALRSMRNLLHKESATPDLMRDLRNRRYDNLLPLSITELIVDPRCRSALRFRYALGLGCGTFAAFGLAQALGNYLAPRRPLP